ncbi:MAG: cell division protein FtsH [Aureliella sp.]
MRVEEVQEGDEKLRRQTAYHEAGHAVMAFSLGRPIQKVTIAPGKLQTGGVRLGVCEMQKGRSKPTDDWLEDEVLILLAGMVAESHVTHQYNPRGASQDLRAVERLLASRAKNEKALHRLHRRMLDKTEHILGDSLHSRAVQLVAEELLAKVTISGRAVRHFFQQAEQQTQ